MSHHHYNIVDELRSWTRFGREPGSDAAVIYHPAGDEYLSCVHDESLAGLGLFLDDVSQFPVGQRVDIVYANEFFSARVCHIELQAGGSYIVGFDCERDGLGY